MNAREGAAGTNLCLPMMEVLVLVLVVASVFIKRSHFHEVNAFWHKYTLAAFVTDSYRERILTKYHAVNTFCITANYKTGMRACSLYV